MRPWIAALLLAGCGSTPPRQPPLPLAPPGAPEIRAVRVVTPLIVDGVANDPAWDEAQETQIDVEPLLHKNLCLRAVVHQGSLFLLLRWEDRFEHGREFADNPPRPSSENARVVYADLVAIEFPMGDETPGGAVYDRWIWDSAAIDKSGHAADCIRRPPKEADSIPFFAFYCRPGQGNVTADSSRSAEDVLARGVWKEGVWTVEFARALSTGHADDRDLGGLSEFPLQIFIEDGGFFRFGSQTGSPTLRLLLPPPEPDDHQGPFPEPRRGSGYGR